MKLTREQKIDQRRGENFYMVLGFILGAFFASAVWILIGMRLGY